MQTQCGSLHLLFPALGRRRKIKNQDSEVSEWQVFWTTFFIRWSSTERYSYTGTLPLSEANIWCKAEAPSNFIPPPIFSPLAAWSEEGESISTYSCCCLSLSLRLSSGKSPVTTKRFSYICFPHSNLLLLMSQGRIAWAFFPHFSILTNLLIHTFYAKRTADHPVGIIHLFILQLIPTPSEKNMPMLNIVYHLLERTFSKQSSYFSLCSCLSGE